MYLLDQDFEKLKRFEQMALQKIYFDDFIYTEDTIVVAVATLEEQAPKQQRLNNLKLVLFDTFILQNNEYVVTDD